MRHAIETVPRDGKVVILEDDVSGSFELAHWSAAARAWVGENGELSKITPTYWHATRRDEHRLQKGDEYLQDCGGGSATQERHYSPFSSGLAPCRVAHAAPVMEAAVEPQTAPSDAERGPSVWRRFFVSSIAAAMVAASLLGMYFRAQIATYVTQCRSAARHEDGHGWRTGRRAKDPVGKPGATKIRFIAAGSGSSSPS